MCALRKMNHETLTKTFTLPTRSSGRYGAPVLDTSFEAERILVSCTSFNERGGTPCAIHGMCNYPIPRNYYHAPSNGWRPTV